MPSDDMMGQEEVLKIIEEADGWIKTSEIKKKAETHPATTKKAIQKVRRREDIKTKVTVEGKKAYKKVWT